MAVFLVLDFIYNIAYNGDRRMNEILSCLWILGVGDHVCGHRVFR